MPMLTTIRSRSGTADAVEAFGACACDGDGADGGKDCTRERDNNAPPLVVLGTLAAPHAPSGPCMRGVAGSGEPFGYAGYAGVAGGGVVPPPPPFTNASSASAMGNILFSDAGGGIPELCGGAYVVCGAPPDAATLGGMYANLESGLGLEGALLVAIAPAPGGIVEARRGVIERGRGAVKRFVPATRFGATGLSGVNDEIRGVVAGNGDGGSGNTSLSVWPSACDRCVERSSTQFQREGNGCVGNENPSSSPFERDPENGCPRTVIVTGRCSSSLREVVETPRMRASFSVAGELSSSTAKSKLYCSCALRRSGNNSRGDFPSPGRRRTRAPPAPPTTTSTASTENPSGA